MLRPYGSQTARGSHFPESKLINCKLTSQRLRKLKTIAKNKTTTFNTLVAAAVRLTSGWQTPPGFGRADKRVPPTRHFRTGPHRLLVFHSLSYKVFGQFLVTAFKGMNFDLKEEQEIEATSFCLPIHSPFSWLP